MPYETDERVAELTERLEKKYIRFIDSRYTTLFHIPDGGRIRVTFPDGEQHERVCRFIDECHTAVGNNLYHICEFAERMERLGARYEPLDYIRDPEFYPKRFFAASEAGKGPAYRIIDETGIYGFAYAPSGAERGRKYCIFKQVQQGNRLLPSKVVLWGGSLREIRPQDWGFDTAKIKAVTQKPKRQTGPKR